jgi:probable phosphoglycerate mutase
LANVYCGRHCDPALTACGRATAAKLRDTLQGVPWAGLYTSPLVRAQQTLLPLAQAVSLEPVLVPALAELDYGDWDGQSQAVLRQRVPDTFAAWHKAPSHIAPPGGESVQMLWRRTRRALDAIVHTHSGSQQSTQDITHVLIVSHKSTLRVALCGLFGLDLDQFRERFTWPLGAMAQVDWTPTGPHLISHGDTEYHHFAASKTSGIGLGV